MGLTPISEIRRRELKQAAFEVLQTEGVHGATLEKVARHAGASKGIVLHYFRNKQQLFSETMRHANALLRDEIVRRLKAARTPAERLWAIVEGNFAPEFFRPSICHAWLSLCAEVPRDGELARVQRVIHARMRSNLVSALVDLVPRDEVEPAALGITTLIDGLWLRAGLRSDGMDGDAALQQMRDYVGHRIPGIALPPMRRPAEARAVRRTGPALRARAHR
jgi:TetR/AcrR family transcriptional repressor of bet genes